MRCSNGIFVNTRSILDWLTRRYDTRVLFFSSGFCQCRRLVISWDVLLVYRCAVYYFLSEDVCVSTHSALGYLQNMHTVNLSTCDIFSSLINSSILMIFNINSPFVVMIKRELGASLQHSLSCRALKVPTAISCDLRQCHTVEKPHFTRLSLVLVGGHHPKWDIKPTYCQSFFISILSLKLFYICSRRYPSWVP